MWKQFNVLCWPLRVKRDASLDFGDGMATIQRRGIGNPEFVSPKSERVWSLACLVNVNVQSPWGAVEALTFNIHRATINGASPQWLASR
jgi:hypothetical protein